MSDRTRWGPSALDEPEEGTKKHAFLEWLLIPQKDAAERNIAEWARNNGVDKATCYGWKRMPGFRRALEKRMDDLNMSPDRVQDVIEAIYRQAKAGDMKAAQLYLQHVDKLTPKTTRVVIERPDIESISDEELADLIR